MFNRIFQTLLITFALLFIGCGSGGGSSSNTDQDVDPIDISEFDSDGDFIPDNIEIFLGTDSNESDENSNGVLDGLETTGIRGDTFFDKQWHIHSLGTETNYSGVATIVGNDLDILEIYHTYMGYNHGDNIIIQVVDTGVDKDHEDLISNMDISRSYNGDEVGDPSAVPDPPDYHYTHGTMVAGIMAAQAFNGKGVRGIIPFAKISGSNFLQNQSYESLSTAWLNGAGANEISVSNNSWGSYYDTDLFYEDLMEEGTKTLRDAKGRVYVFAAGNRREYKGNANLQYRLSNRYAIVVAALKHDNTHASYSNPGANILVSGYSGEYYQISPTIGTTTDMGSSSNGQTTWDEDVNENYTFTMNGTSAASPTVAASIALVLEACPDLTWRDVKYLVAKNAISINTANDSWIQNSSGLWHSIDYGFGLINTKGMIDECLSTTYENLPTETNQTVTIPFNSPIPDNNTTQKFTIDIPDSITVEWVEVTLDNNSTWASDYRVELTSPAGTKTTLMTENSIVSADETGNWMDGGFRFATSAMIDEEGQGKWIVGIRDMLNGNTGNLSTIKLQVYGH